MLGPMSITGSIGQILFARYMPPAGIALLLWDHCLTFDEEVTTIWASFKGPILPKVIYVMNRYFTEAVLLYTAYIFAGLRQPTANKVGPWRFCDNLTLMCASVFWLLPISSTLVGGILQFLIMLRAYRLWDHKQTMRKVLIVVFVACMIGSLVLSVRMALTLMRAQVILPPWVIVCAVPEVPKDAPFLMGILLLFNLFVLLVSFYNALEEPRRRESEVFHSLQRDGAKVYFVVCLLWVMLLIASVVAEMLVYFPVLILAWSVGANLTSRMQLRIESLGRSNIAHPTMIYSTPED
ncbi:hypothetical protein IW261DRAFT_1612898 [Armillaria novae-zelandiae]|uniref:DUF6533 domain-containing protein n=1 Tax=Armillaria novae-zelandiae TaxID=153914 RepID=A0AA39TZQ7_9AGAR|nr:hypothetical protein IW261DRAFT_1612898 [Armillaria novae-zelandiae]